MSMRFDVQSKYRSFAFCVEARKLFVNPYTLAALSPVFEKMCLGTFKEASDRHAALEDEKFDEVKELFCTIMTTEDEIMLKPVTVDNCAFLIVFADKYDIGGLRRLLQNFFEKADLTHMSPEHRFLCLVSIVKHRLSREALLNVMQYVALMPIETLIGADLESELPKPITAAVYCLHAICAIKHDCARGLKAHVCCLGVREDGAGDNNCKQCQYGICPIRKLSEHTVAQLLDKYDICSGRGL